MKFPLIAVFLVFGCAPPELSGDFGQDSGANAGSQLPTIRIVYPPNGGEIILTSTDDPEGPCRIKTVVAIDVDHYAIVPDSETEVEGEGHWHLKLEGEDYVKVIQQHGELISQRQYLPGGLKTISAELVSNTHQKFVPVISTLVEFALTAPLDGTNCAVLP
ncbi:MAG: hypothetical protein GWP91_08715 [Rhodobacterales bacterium]|nr:hypothetical protein [Rhodobacterales bacterium]